LTLWFSYLGRLLVPRETKNLPAANGRLAIKKRRQWPAEYVRLRMKSETRGSRRMFSMLAGMDAHLYTTKRKQPQQKKEERDRWGDEGGFRKAWCALIPWTINRQTFCRERRLDTASRFEKRKRALAKESYERMTTGKAEGRFLCLGRSQ